MKRHRNLLGLAALLALAVPLLAPARAAADAELRKSDTQRQLEEVRAEIEKLRELTQIHSRMQALELKLLHERLDRIEAGLARLTSEGTRRASSFTPSEPVRRGTLRLSNRLPVTAFVTVNGVTYSVPPFGLRTLRDVPVGALSYEVTATGYYNRAASTTTLGAEETLTVNINAPAVPVVSVPVVVLP
jgi:hypothetical protein